MFTVQVEVDGAIHKLDTLAESAADLEKPLRYFGEHLQRRALERYKAQSFAPLAEGTIDKRAQKGLQIMEGKLRRDLARAQGRARKLAGADKAPRGLLGTVLSKLGAGGATADASATTTRGVANRQAVLAEFRRRHGMHAMKGGRSRVVESAGLKSLSLKQMQGLSMRTVRQVASTVGRPILGGLPQTLEVEVGPGIVTLRSRTREEWSDVHNEGGTAGHGAVIPERKTIEVDSSDLDVFVSILRTHLLMGVTEGMHGPGF